MKILVTGGCGLVGSHCAEYFAQKNNRVVVVDNLMRSTIFRSQKKSVEYNWHYLSKLKNIVLFKKDIRDREEMERIFKREKPDAVIHTAGQPGVRYSLDDPLEDYSINATGSLIVLEALKKANKNAKFVYCSTNKVYGDNVNALPIKEKAYRYEFKGTKGVAENYSVDLTGHTPYGVSKLTGDLYTQDYSYVHGIKCAVFRMSCIYGTRQFGFEDQGWIAWFCIKSFLGEPITIFGDGKQLRDVLWVGDLVRAYESFITSDLAGEVFNMGGGCDNTLSLLELVSLLEKITGNKAKLRFKNWRKFDQKVYISDISKAKRLLRWKPSVSPANGTQRLFDWISSNPHLFQ